MYKKNNLLYSTIFYQLQDLIVALDVIVQFEQFLYQIKGANAKIQMVQLMLQKIKMMQLYMEIKLIYIPIRINFCIMVDVYLLPLMHDMVCFGIAWRIIAYPCTKETCNFCFGRFF